MLDEQYKELLNSMEEQPPMEAWNAIEKALRPWYVQPWAKTLFFSSVVAASLGVFYLITSDTFHTKQEQVNHTTQVETSNEVKTSEPFNEPKADENSKSITNAEVKASKSEVNTNANKAGQVVVSGSESNGNAGNSSSQTGVLDENGSSNSAISNPLANNRTRKLLSLKLNQKEVCAGKVVIIRISGCESSMMLDFGDQHQVNLVNSKMVYPYSYESPGIYTITIKSSTNELLASENIQVDEKPQAYFKSKVSENTSINFENLSVATNSFIWYFDDGKQVSVQDKNLLNHYFASSSRQVYKVKLIALNTATGCSDTFESEVKNPNFRNYYFTTIPNVFTPNNDGLNDVFEIPASDLKEWHIIVMDGAGRVVFESDDQRNNWNGKLNNLGAECSRGMYRYIIKYMQPDDQEMHQKAGIITLIRE